MIQITTQRLISKQEQKFYDVMANHYKERITNEKRIEAKRILRPRLQNIKGILSSNAINTCICE